MRQLLNSLWVFLLCPVFLLAGSYFGSSSHGIGTKNLFLNARAAGMGNAGLAAMDSLALSQYGLAQWYRINDTRITVSLEYSWNRARYSGVQLVSATTIFQGLSLAIPVQRHRWVVGLTVQPYTLLDAQFQKSFQETVVDYQQTVVSRGSITKGQLVVVWAPAQRFALALAGNYYFGALQDKFQLEFNSGDFYNASHQIQYRVTGPGAGLYLTGAITPGWWLAAFWEWRPHLRVKKVYSSVLKSGQERLAGVQFFPVQGGVGTSLRLGKRWQITSDFLWQKWSDGFGLQSTESEALEDWFRLGLGMERSMKFGRDVALLDRVDWRWGLSVQRLGYRFHNNAVYQYALHLGTGIPMFFAINRLDVAVVGGYRGDEQRHGAREWFISFQFSVSMGERWFQRFR